MLEASCHCGATGWTLEGDPGPVTARNCSLCHRYGALWAYDYEDGRIALRGAPASYRRVGKADPALEILFCPACAAVLAWRGLRQEADGRRRMAVNVRLAPIARGGASADRPFRRSRQLRRPAGGRPHGVGHVVLSAERR